MTDAPLVPRIIYENENFLAIDKPSGLMVHPARHTGKGMAKTAVRERESTLVDWLLENRPEVKNVGDDPATRPGIVHRLDKETSGVMLVAKNQAYFEYLKSLFQNHEVKKTYYAIVRGVPQQKKGIINAPIGIKNGTLKRSVRSTKMQKEAITEYEQMREFHQPGDEKTFSLLAVYPKTGRTHQIRVHLASIGHPIVGDKLYGPKVQPLWAHRLMLHAGGIEFPEENGRMIRIESELSTSFTLPFQS
jgi:23S rRNA pseudouridine1911/1915/1917 synthase